MPVQDNNQVFNIEISRVVTKSQVQILEDSKGNRFVAPFTKEVTTAVRYGKGVNVYSVYMSQFKLIPYNRIQYYFR